MSFSPLSLAFALAPRLPLGVVMRLAQVGADVASVLGGKGVAQLRANLERLMGAPADSTLMRHAVRSHIRNYAEQLMLGSPAGAPLLEGVTFEGFDALKEASSDGPVVLALGHSGSWDRAGAWVCAHGRTIVTVAEKVEPPSLFDRFVALREGVGMEVLGVGKGDSIFSTLVEKVKGRPVIVPLLADRDISGSGIEVDFAGHRALVAAGPAALAHRLDRPLFVACITYENERGGGADVRIRCEGPITASNMHTNDSPHNAGSRLAEDDATDPNHVERLTQAWVSAFTRMMADKPEDWHMMQKVFVSDLDAQRLARARESARRKKGEEQ